MDSQEFAQERPWISYQTARRIVDEHGLWEDFETAFAEHEIRFSGTGCDLKIDTASLLLWLGY